MVPPLTLIQSYWLKNSKNVIVVFYFVDPIQEPWKKSDEYKKLRKHLYRYQYALAGSILVFVMLMFILASFLVSDTFNTCPKPIDAKVNHSNHSVILIMSKSV